MQNTRNDWTCYPPFFTHLHRDQVTHNKFWLNIEMVCSYLAERRFLGCMWHQINLKCGSCFATNWPSSLRKWSQNIFQSVDFKKIYETLTQKVKSPIRLACYWRRHIYIRAFLHHYKRLGYKYPNVSNLDSGLAELPLNSGCRSIITYASPKRAMPMKIAKSTSSWCTNGEQVWTLILYYCFYWNV